MAVGGSLHADCKRCSLQGSGDALVSLRVVPAIDHDERADGHFTR